MKDHRFLPLSLQDRVGARIASRLNEHIEQTPHEVSERLRIAREHALQHARSARAAATPVVAFGNRSSGAVLALGGGANSGPSWWTRWASVLPLIVLLGGLMLIGRAHEQAQLAAAAEVDSLILTDDLPPAAYSDPGFIEFLKAPRN